MGEVGESSASVTAHEWYGLEEEGKGCMNCGGDDEFEFENGGGEDEEDGHGGGDEEDERAREGKGCVNIGGEDDVYIGGEADIDIDAPIEEVSSDRRNGCVSLEEEERSVVGVLCILNVGVVCTLNLGVEVEGEEEGNVADLPDLVVVVVPVPVPLAAANQLALVPMNAEPTPTALNVNTGLSLSLPCPVVDVGVGLPAGDDSNDPDLVQEVVMYG